MTPSGTLLGGARCAAVVAALAAGGAVTGCGGANPTPDTTIAVVDTFRGAVADSAPTMEAATPRVAPGRGVATQDTVRGTVSEVGSYPMISVVVQPAAGRAITISGSLSPEIARAAGAEVWVAGRLEGRTLDANAYAVTRVDGEPAVDGILALDGDRIVLVTPAGRRQVARPLQALRGMIGARVWLVGPLDGTITSYGVLREP